jgi:transcriptional regulator with XRE-family HTH domain
MNAMVKPVGHLLREWRQRRRMTQLDFACEADISTRHLSFLETGRSQPSRHMLLHLAELLDVPLRERNQLLIAAGFAPMYAERTLDDPALTAARRAIDLVLKGHEPFPALAVDRHWNMVAANAAVGALLVGVSAELLQPPVNVLRLSLHPDGLAPRIANLPEWRDHLLARLRRQVEATADVALSRLLHELEHLSDSGATGKAAAHIDYGGVVIPFQLTTPAGVLSFLGTTTVFGTPVDVTLSELAIEAFFPADEFTASAIAQSAAKSKLAGS